MKKTSLLVSLFMLGLATSCSSVNGTKPGQTTPGQVTTSKVDNKTTTKGNSSQEISLAYRELSQEINNYYKDVDTTKRGDEFLSSLTDTITKDYVKASYSKAWEILADADQDPYNSNNIICVYTGRSIAANVSGQKAWNREHAWPKSHGFNSESLDAYTDCHHLTASESSINNARGNMDIGEVADFEGTVSKDGYGNKWINNVIFEPRDEVKGDFARKLLYMVARYNSSELDLTLVEKDKTPTSATDVSEKKGTLGVLSTLLKWHYMDPVSDSEIRRNDVVYSYQKNRNPFIDHPEWVNFAFDSSYTDATVDGTKVKEAMDAISALPETITLDNKDAVDACYAKVSALNAQEKLFVSNYPTLTKAKTQIVYLDNKSQTSDASICIDLAADKFTKQTTGYEANYTFTVSDYTFKTSSAMVDGSGLTVGTNAKKIAPGSLSAYGVDGSGSWMEAQFSTKGIKKIVVRSTKDNTSSVVICVKNGSTYTPLTTVKTNKDPYIYFTAECDSVDGTFVIVMTGEKPRLAIDQIEIYN